MVCFKSNKDCLVKKSKILYDAVFGSPLLVLHKFTACIFPSLLSQRQQYSHTLCQFAVTLSKKCSNMLQAWFSLHFESRSDTSKIVAQVVRQFKLNSFCKTNLRMQFATHYRKIQQHHALHQITCHCHQNNHE